jgi:glycosidase
MYIILDIILNHTGDNWGYPGDYPYYYWPEAPGPFDFSSWREADPAPGLQEDDAVWPQELQEPDYYKRRGQIRNWGDYYEAINGDFCSLKETDIHRYIGRNSRLPGTNERFPSLDAARSTRFTRVLPLSWQCGFEPDCL